MQERKIEMNKSASFLFPALMPIFLMNMLPLSADFQHENRLLLALAWKAALHLSFPVAIFSFAQKEVLFFPPEYFSFISLFGFVLFNQVHTGDLSAVRKDSRIHAGPGQRRVI